MNARMPHWRTTAPGVANGLELAIRLVDFCDARADTDEIIYDITAQFGVSRATAYRWYHAYCDARGIATLDEKRRQA